MARDQSKDRKGGDKKLFLHSSGITYFDKKVERNLFFVLTIVMLVLGILYKMGWIGGR